MYKTLLFFQFILFAFIASAQNNQYISFRQTSDIAVNHKKSTNTTDIYFDKGKNTLTKHLFVPEEMVTISNELGELKIYHPQSNKLSFKHMEALSSKNSLIYYFSNNLTDHLGLADEGFSLIDRSYDADYLITTWKAPAKNKQISLVKMVFKMGNPVYSEYINAKDDVTKKIYYTQYQDFISFRMPLKIVEISYNPSGDSIVNRTIFSNIEVSNTPNSDFFNFKVPDDAKPISTK